MRTHLSHDRQGIAPTDLVVGLHGYGGNGADMVRRLVAARQSRSIEILAPDGPAPAQVVSTGRAWYGATARPETMIVRAEPVARSLAPFIEEFADRLRIPRERRCVVAFSQGTTVATHLIQMSVVSRGVLVCGRVLWSEAPWRRTVPLLVIAGEHDRFTPPDVLVADLTDRSPDVRMIIWRGLGHELRSDVARTAVDFAADHWSSPGEEDDDNHVLRAE